MSQREATVRVGLASEQQRTLCRPVQNGRVATPERWLFSEQLHLAPPREATSHPTPTMEWLECSFGDLISRSEVLHVKYECSKLIRHLQFGKTKSQVQLNQDH